MNIHYKNDSHASTVSHTENCLLQLEDDIRAFGSEDQRVILQQALDLLEVLYFTLREEK